MTQSVYAQVSPRTPTPPGKWKPVIRPGEGTNVSGFSALMRHSMAWPRISTGPGRISARVSPCAMRIWWILEGDIKSCFDAISHDWLLAHVPTDRAILQKWLKAGYMEKHVLHETTEGTPQGGIISAALANCALDGLERVLREKYPSRTRLKSL